MVTKNEVFDRSNRETRDIARRAFLLTLVGGAACFFFGCDEANFHKVALKLVSPEDLREFGLQTWQRIQKDFPVSRDEALQKRLRLIGDRVVKAAGASSGDWEFVVFGGDTINAFAVPSKQVGFFEGMFAVAENDAQIAAVLGHEIGHINAQHAAERMVTAFAKQAGIKVVLAALKAGDVDYANEIAGLLGAGVEYGIVRAYSRRQEYEADRLGAEYMARAGYSSEQAVEFWLNMMAVSQGRPKPLEFLSTHPSDEKRIVALREVIKTLRQSSI
ncbi:MAG: M48 family metallopeptidase [Syntrophobacteraceae bacterium]